MAQRALDDFAGDVYDPTKEFCGCGSDVVDRNDAFDQIEEKYRRTSTMASGGGAGEKRTLAEMETYGEVLERIKNGADLDDLKADMVVESHDADEAMESAASDEEEAIHRGTRNAADYVVDVLGGSHP